MYTPPAFREDDPAELRRIMREARLPTLVTATPDGLVATPVPLFLDEGEGERGVLYGHVAKANPQWRLAVLGDALAMFAGPLREFFEGYFPVDAATVKVSAR